MFYYFFFHPKIFLHDLNVILCAVDLSGRMSADISVCHLSITHLINLISFSLGSRDIARTGSQSARAFPQRTETDTLRNCVCSYAGRFLSRFKKEHSFLPLRFVSIQYIRKYTSSTYFFLFLFFGCEYTIPLLPSRYSKTSPRNGLDLSFSRSRTNRPTNFDAVRHFYGLCFQ